MIAFPASARPALLLLAFSLISSSCALRRADDRFAIPRPASSVTRAEAVATAYTYTQVEWLPEARHILHGPDKNGIAVQTPDASLTAYGWWKPGVPAKGMPYQWGGFDTPQQFLASLKKGEAAGDISTPAKRVLDDAGTSQQATGIDCSGFVSRCWRLPRPYSTRQLPEICDRLPSWKDLKPGDIVLNDRHVLLFVRWSETHPGEACFYEAGPKPVWRVNAAGLTPAALIKQGYAPWRYRQIRD